jgi:hypothetical protein
MFGPTELSRQLAQVQLLFIDFCCHANLRVDIPPKMDAIRPLQEWKRRHSSINFIYDG